jgi:hypothetical protein
MSTPLDWEKKSSQVHTLILLHAPPAVGNPAELLETVELKQLPHCRCTDSLLRSQQRYSNDNQNKKLCSCRRIKLSKRVKNS